MIREMGGPGGDGSVFEDRRAAPAPPVPVLDDRAPDRDDAAEAGATDGGLGAPRLRAESPAGVLRLQRQAGNAAVAGALDDSREDDAASSGAARSPVLDVVERTGSPLDGEVRRSMEAGLGGDFSDVRVHTDGPAAESARAVDAHAYTVGNDVVFGDGAYDPGSAEGQRTLAHELTHVVQQRSGPVEGTPAGGGIALSDPSDRFEVAAEEAGNRFVAPAPVATDRDEDRP
ncbi:MAG TPA: DUF4157 domain-containing protein [Acidimicrobiales bacterium]|nr:DUF4157 domain-containing protein [Acidimicrobiales bacterium]